MKGLNKVFIMGHVGNDPEIKLSNKGKNFARLSIATNNFRINPESGERAKETAWHTVFVWGKQGELCAQYLRKGSPVLVEGYMSPYVSTDKSGDRQYKVSVHADRVDFLPATGPRTSEPKFESEEQIEY